MTKKAFKSQASSSRAVSGALGSFTHGAGFGASASPLGGVSSSSLSHVYEPPDLSGLTDPNVGVAFKNLQKRDATTKSKALEELQTYTQSSGTGPYGVEGKMLEAWTNIYPRLSIDNSRRVRQLAHDVQGQIAISCGKRILRCMPLIVGAWLAGIYDQDRSVSRAAQESFKLVFPSEEKYRNVWRMYQADIVQFSRCVIGQETPNTLSDERTTSPDDALSKYTRTLGSVISMITNLLETVVERDLTKCSSQLHDMLEDAQLWKLASYSDAFVRRAIYRLLVVALAKSKNDLDPSTISATVLTSTLHCPQTGSAYDYARALALLTAEIPSVWTIYYHGTGKKSAINRLCHFLRKGSQGGPPEFWCYIEGLIRDLPAEVLGHGSYEANRHPSDELPPIMEVLEALHDGIASKDEPRTNSGPAWEAYLSTAQTIWTSLESSGHRSQLLLSSVLPILPQQIRPLLENSRWTVLGPQQQTICIKACIQVLRQDGPLFADQWRTLSGHIIKDITISLPERSEDCGGSQDSLGAEAKSWYGLQAALLTETGSSFVNDLLSNTLDLELEATISTLKAGNGKPYGAAAFLATAIELLPESILTVERIKTRLCTFANHDIPDLLLSPSANNLIHAMELLQYVCDVRQGFTRCTIALAEAPESALKRDALQALLSSPSIASNSSLPLMAKESLQAALRTDNTNDWDIVVAAANNAKAPKDLTDDILLLMTESLSMDAQRLPSLHGFELLRKHNMSLLVDYTATPKGSALLARLLYLADDRDDVVAQRANGLARGLQDAMLAGSDGSQASGVFLNLLKRNFDDISTESLSVELLVKQAQKAFLDSPEADKPGLIGELLPGPDQWSKALEPFLAYPPNPSIATTNSFGGAIAFIKNAVETKLEVSRDVNRQSLLLRMGRFVVDLLHDTNAFDISTPEQRLVITKNLAITLQLAGDNLSLQGSMPLWVSSKLDKDVDLVEFVARGQSLIASWLHKIPKSVLTENVLGQLLEWSLGLSSAAYYSGRAYAAIVTGLNDLLGPSKDEDSSRLKTIVNSPDTFTAIALLVTASGGQGLLHPCNELLTDLTVISFDAEPQKCLHCLVLLNCILYGSENLIIDVSKQRLIFFVKHIVDELPKAVITGQAEIMKALYAVLPLIKDIYGSFWGVLVEHIRSTFHGSVTDETLPLLSASLRLLSLLRKPLMQDGNDDLLEAWAGHRSYFAKDLIGLMKKLKDPSDEAHQPRRIVNELLRRHIAGLGTDIAEDVEGLYPVLASESEALQTAAYEALHAIVPAKQEELSLEKALEKGYQANLPDELLSLILAPPSMDVDVESDTYRNKLSFLRSYLLSWKVTFDHWSNASYALQVDYAGNLAEGTYLANLLDLTFSLLITSRHKSVDASKFPIETYEPGQEPQERDTQALMIHLYYLSLLNIPSPAKTWWRDTSSRQIKLPIQNWTEKYISPIIIAAELSAIKEWASSQTATDDTPLTIKVSHTTREVTASIPIDEQNTSISIRLPPSYPLSRAEITGIHRVGIPENKWNSWIRNAQGQLTTSDGGRNALIDCLLAWKRNVTAALKGQTECAICYSVVGADRTLPKKKCPTIYREDFRLVRSNPEVTK
ncbi:MAG: hypothetical protein Q9163_003096 [Psora crenata]